LISVQRISALPGIRQRLFQQPVGVHKTQYKQFAPCLPREAVRKKTASEYGRSGLYQRRMEEISQTEIRFRPTCQSFNQLSLVRALRIVNYWNIPCFYELNSYAQEQVHVFMRMVCKAKALG
jgi:hypothetical protein